MTGAEMAHVARADFGSDAQRHRQALTALLADATMTRPPGATRFPAAVVELVSQVPGQPRHVPCLAIVLLDAMRDADARGTAAARLETPFAEIARLRPAARDALFAGFRHLYETKRDWSPALPAPFTLPWGKV